MFTARRILQEVQRQGDELAACLKSLAGVKNNNPRNAPGVPYTKWQPGFVPTNRSGKALHAKGESAWQLLQQLSLLVVSHLLSVEDLYLLPLAFCLFL